MKLRKFALTGLISLAVFVALCMFFSGTIRTISTAKVKLVSPKYGKMEQRVSLSGLAAFPDIEDISIQAEAGQSAVIAKINTRVGYTVKAGDVVIEATVSGYDAAMKELKSNYGTVLDSLLALESKSAGIRVRATDQAYADAYYALREAKEAVMTARVTMNAALQKRGLTLPESGYPEGADEDATAAIDAYRGALAAQDRAQTDYDAASRYSVDENTWSYISQKRGFEAQLRECEEKMADLDAMRERVCAVTAPRDGYIAAIYVKAGDSWDGATPLFAMTAEGTSPVLRAKIEDVTSPISTGATINIATTRFGTLETQVANTGVDAEGKRYCDVTITEDMLSALGSVYALTQSETPMTLAFKAKDSTCLLPASAVRGSGKDRYVLVVNTSQNSFSGQSMTVSKMSVTLLTEADGTASVSEDISYYTLAYMEDRQIKDGDAVMEYSN